jgi:hypothetical protein
VRYNYYDYHHDHQLNNSLKNNMIVHCYAVFRIGCVKLQDVIISVTLSKKKKKKKSMYTYIRISTVMWLRAFQSTYMAITENVNM